MIVTRKFDWKLANRLNHLCSNSLGSNLDDILVGMSDAQQIEFMKRLLWKVNLDYMEVYAYLCESELAKEFEVTLADTSPNGASKTLSELKAGVLSSCNTEKSCRNCKHCLVEFWNIDGINAVFSCDCRDDTFEKFDPTQKRICDKWERK